MEKKAKKRTRKPKLPFQYTCQSCKKSDKSVRPRDIYTENYMGPCGDSFCYASCEMSTCTPVHGSICDACADKLSKKT